MESTITHTNFIPGDYFYRYYSAGNAINILNEKCRIISDVIQLTILPDTYEVSDTICEGLIYEFGSQMLTEEGAYVEDFESQLGCDSTVFLDLVFIPPQPFVFKAIGVQNPSCFGFEDGMISINSITGGNGMLDIALLDGVNEISGDSLPSGSYTVYVEDQYKCFDTQLVELIDPPEISVEIGSDTTIRLGDELIYFPEYSTVFESVVWSGQGEFSCVECEEPVFVPYFSGYVSAVATDENGCIAVDSMNIIVDEQNFITLPNVFSPNEDRINDFFTINFYGRSVSELNSFKVFDRWGGIVHETVNQKVESGEAIWDGYKKSGEVEVGVYGYVLEVTLINNVKISVIGDVTVLK